MLPTNRRRVDASVKAAALYLLGLATVASWKVSTGSQYAKPVKSGCSRIGYVHVPKTGGSTIIAVLRNTTTDIKETILPTLPSDPYSWYHSPALAQQAYFGNDEWDQAWTFALVRNPYIYIMSHFFFSFSPQGCERTTADYKLPADQVRFCDIMLANNWTISSSDHDFATVKAKVEAAIFFWLQQALPLPA